MALFQGVLLMILGAGVVGVAYRSLSTGWLPCGPDGKGGRLEFHRDRQPLRYWLMFLVYGLGGAWVAGYGLLILSGQVEPLPLQ